MPLPIESIHNAFLTHHARGAVVVSAPTGSGKSTVVPTWCSGRVLVVEPRRVACRSLAHRVAELDQTPLGQSIGYHVRDDKCVDPSARIVFATPGVVLRMIDEARRFDTVVLDEFHERRLDVDLLLALFRQSGARLLVMSATMDAERVAQHVGGVHLRAEGRVHPVEIRHLPDGAFLPEGKGLVQRVEAALTEARDVPGDVLVFVPGKAEVAAVAQALRCRGELDVFELHGGLSLAEQTGAFAPSCKRKVVVATNVAETSITIPGISVVIDSGLVRRTRYHQGRGYLTLVPIAMDSADQRAGRAGRTGPGLCFRLWSQTAKLAASTPPEVHRESLVPLVLAAAACGSSMQALSFFDPPKEHAVQAATDELRALGALDDAGRLSACGRELFGLPLDPWLGRLLVEARAAGTLEDIIDLVAALEPGRPVFQNARPHQEEDDLRRTGCDATALIRAVRIGRPAQHRLSGFALSEARSTARRLRRAFSLPRREDKDPPIDRKRLILTALRADPRCAHVARKRRSRIAWANGGTEIELARESAVQDQEKTEAIVVFATRAMGVDVRRTRIIATCASPVPIGWLVEAGLGRDRVANAVLEQGRVVARIERVFAKKVLQIREAEPVGAAAREAVARLFLQGRLYPEARTETRRRLAATALAARLRSASLPGSAAVKAEVSADGRTGGQADVQPPPSLESWVMQRLAELGVEHGDDVALLTENDFLAPPVPQQIQRLLEREFPLEVHLGDAQYEVDYDLGKRQVLLRLVRGQRRAPPPLSYLPRFAGFRVCVEAGGTVHVLKEW
ncbi:MAG: helicase-related protein [Myxococcota bacterium]